MAVTKPTQARGAAIEREAIRDFLSRKLKASTDPFEMGAFKEVLKWVNTRPSRYNPRPGGLGKKIKGGR